MRAYYDASGNMTALVVHRPAGCGREDELGTSTPAAGGPDGAGCREGDDFRLMFAWDEVGNLLAVERQSLVDAGTCTAPGGGIEILDSAYEEYLGPGDPEDHEWCPAARLASTYDFGGQRRLKYETNITDDAGRIPELGSLYVSASYEVREAELNPSTGIFDRVSAIDARYLWNEAGILFELDSAVPDGAPSPKTRLTLTNQIGSASSVLDADLGSVSQILSQLPYGAEEQTLPRVALDAPPAFVPRYEFTGKERDRGVGLVYFGARSLDARLGRWVSTDPLAVQGSLGNAYAYAASNAVRLVDRVGLDDVDAGTPDVAPAGDNTADAGPSPGKPDVGGTQPADAGGWSETRGPPPPGQDAGPHYQLETTTFVDRDTGALTSTSVDPVAGSGPDAHVAYIPPNPGETALAEVALATAAAVLVATPIAAVARVVLTALGLEGPAAGTFSGLAAGAAGGAAASVTSQLGTTGEIDPEELAFSTTVGAATGAIGGSLQCRDPSPADAFRAPPASPGTARRPYEPPSITGTASAGRYRQPDGSMTDVLQRAEHPGLGPFDSRTHTHPASVHVNPADPTRGSTTLGDPRSVTGEEVQAVTDGSATRVGPRGR
ncbi:MAG: hypothetical protein GYA57_05950 [Myxococcales bacterium]|nr:hypothetical protein [Myxococcales bacterium]